MSTPRAEWEEYKRRQAARRAEDTKEYNEDNRHIRDTHPDYFGCVFTERIKADLMRMMRITDARDAPRHWSDFRSLRFSADGERALLRLLGGGPGGERWDFREREEDISERDYLRRTGPEGAAFVAELDERYWDARDFEEGELARTRATCDYIARRATETSAAVDPAERAARFSSACALISDDAIRKRALAKRAGDDILTVYTGHANGLAPDRIAEMLQLNEPAYNRDWLVSGLAAGLDGVERGSGRTWRDDRADAEADVRRRRAQMHPDRV